MTYQDTPTASTWLGLSNAIHQWKVAFLANRRERAAYNTTFSELSAMSDRDLADIGLSRGDIPDVAAKAAAMKR